MILLAIFLGTIFDPDSIKGQNNDWGGKIQVKPEEIIEANPLLAATSPEYLKSIREARADYKAKRVRTHAEVFG